MLHKSNGLLKYGVIFVVAMVLLSIVYSAIHKSSSSPTVTAKEGQKIRGLSATQNSPTDTASTDSAAESLDTLTAELATTKNTVTQIAKDNAELKQQNQTLMNKLNGTDTSNNQSLSAEIQQIKNQLQQKTSGYPINNNQSAQPIGIVPDLTKTPAARKNPLSFMNNSTNPFVINPTPSTPQKPKVIPYYTIPPNATAVRDRLMTPLIGRIPVKGVVTDPYPFKIVFSDDTLAANGLRIPGLMQMIVSGYAVGDLGLYGVRGWVTSLTFVFQDGTISTTTSNNNDIGNFTKQNALGYLSDAYGNPCIPGYRLISNAPKIFTGNVILGGTQGFANAYAQSQVTNQASPFGSVTSSVTGSPFKYSLGQTGSSAADAALQWWQDREAQSFDAIYVPTVDKKGNPVYIAVNFTKEIDIDYNPTGRKIFYENSRIPYVTRSLD